MKATLFVDQRTKDAIENMPRKMSASKLFRWFMVMLTCSDKEWERIRKEEPEILEVQEYIRPKLRRMIGKEDIKK